MRNNTISDLEIFLDEKEEFFYSLYNRDRIKIEIREKIKNLQSEKNSFFMKRSHYIIDSFNRISIQAGPGMHSEPKYLIDSNLLNYRKVEVMYFLNTSLFPEYENVLESICLDELIERIVDITIKLKNTFKI